MLECLFASDLHGSDTRFRKLFETIEREKPDAVFLGGDLLPGFRLSAGIPSTRYSDFYRDVLVCEFRRLKDQLGATYPQVFLILGNDDDRVVEPDFIDASRDGLWHYMHERSKPLRDHTVIGYSYVPPSPFLLKDWERYDVSQYVDPGCVSPEEGVRTIPVDEDNIRFATIAEDLERMTRDDNLSQSIFLFHSPPYKTKLDRAALDDMKFDHVPLDVHVGSIAIKRFIEHRQPLLTLHGHIHESARLTGSWQDRIGRTLALTAAHDGPELALIHFDLPDLKKVTRELH